MTTDTATNESGDAQGSVPYELPDGYTVDRWGYLRGPDGSTVASTHLGDGLWVGYSGGVDTHPIRRSPDHPITPFGTFACTSGNCERKGFGIRRSAFISSLPLPFLVSERLRRRCWELVESGAMSRYDEHHIKMLAVSMLDEQIADLKLRRSKVLGLEHGED